MLSLFSSLRNADGRGDGGSSCSQTAVETAAFYARYLYEQIHWLL